MVKRDEVPARIKRAVLVEAGHRCAIPACRATTTEIAHIVPWCESHDNKFENLIALCPTCHARYDQKKEIDRQSIRMYKNNLSLLNYRYGEFERRLFEVLYRSGERLFVVGLGGDLLVANAVKDGLFLDLQVTGMSWKIKSEDGTVIKSFPMQITYRVTDEGVEFLQKWVRGKDLG